MLMSLVRMLVADRKSCCISARCVTSQVAPTALLYSWTEAARTIMPSAMAMVISSKLKPKWRVVDGLRISLPLPELRNERCKNIIFRNPSARRVVLNRDVDCPQRGNHVSIGVGDGL